MKHSDVDWGSLLKAWTAPTAGLQVLNLWYKSKNKNISNVPHTADYLFKTAFYAFWGVIASLSTHTIALEESMSDFLPCLVWNCLYIWSFLLKNVSFPPIFVFAISAVLAMHYEEVEQKGPKCSTLNYCFSTDFRRKIVKFCTKIS